MTSISTNYKRWRVKTISNTTDVIPSFSYITIKNQGTLVGTKYVGGEATCTNGLGESWTIGLKEVTDLGKQGNEVLNGVEIDATGTVVQAIYLE